MQGIFNPFQPRVAFHIETSHLISSAKKMSVFYMKLNTEIKWVKKGWEYVQYEQKKFILVIEGNKKIKLL